MRKCLGCSRLCCCWEPEPSNPGTLVYVRTRRHTIHHPPVQRRQRKDGDDFDGVVRFRCPDCPDAAVEKRISLQKLPRKSGIAAKQCIKLHSATIRLLQRLVEAATPAWSAAPSPSRAPSWLRPRIPPSSPACGARGRGGLTHRISYRHDWTLTFQFCQKKLLRPGLSPLQTISLCVESNGPQADGSGGRSRRNRRRRRRGNKTSLLDFEAALTSSFATASEGAWPRTAAARFEETQGPFDRDHRCRCRMQRSAGMDVLDEPFGEEGRSFQRGVWRQELRYKDKRNKMNMHAFLSPSVHI